MSIVFLDYEILRLIWWVVLGVLLIGFAIMDGFDLGVATLLPWLAKNDEERRLVINSVGPVWEGNQVWFILGGGAAFAAWPPLYAASFSGFYVVMFLVLCALILRPVGFKFRSKVEDPRWRAFWDYALFVGGVVPSLVFGVAMGNLFLGVPFSFDADLRPFYDGAFWQLLNPFGLFCGVVSLLMLVTHGANYMALKLPEPLETRALKTGSLTAKLFLLLFIIGGYWAFKLNGYVITSMIDGAAPSNPLYKTVTVLEGGWFENYMRYPWMILAPALAVIGSLVVIVCKNAMRRFIGSALMCFGAISTVGVCLYPFIMPSSSNPVHSLTVWDASSSHMTLFIMTVVTVIFLPIVLAYTAWVYRVLSGKVTAASINKNESAY